MLKKILLFSIATIFTLQLSAQQQARFKAGIVAGLNFSQLEGESLTDYFGLNAGFIGSARLNENLQISTELLFSQNGEYILPFSYPRIRYGTVRLNHIEIPVHLDVLIRVFQKEQFEDWQLHFGAAYTQVFSHYAEDYDGIDVTEQIIYENRKSINAQVGTTYFFTKNIGLNLKASIPVQKKGLALTIAARAVYIFEA